VIKIRESINIGIAKWDEGIRKASSEKVAIEALRAKRRWLCRNDLFYLAYITRHDKIVKWRKIYEPFCDEVSLMTWRMITLGIEERNEDLLRVEDVTDDVTADLGFYKRLYLCYRAFYKTTIITKLHSLQLLLNFPNTHFVLCHNKQENASDNLVAVKNMLLDDVLKGLFPECVPETKDWGNASGFSLANRTDMQRTEANIEAVGVDTEVTGRHWKLAKKNDLVTERSVTTKEQIIKTASWDERFNLGLFDDPQLPLQDYEGTRYHFADLYSSLRGDPKIKLIEIPLLDGDGEILHKGRFTEEGIKPLMKNRWVFNCQMLLRPEDPDKAQFKSEMIVYWDVIPDGGFNYLIVDPASARKKKSDYTVMKVVKVILNRDGDMERYILDMVRDKVDPRKRVDLAIELAKEWNIRGCGWEAIGFQTTDCFYLEERRRKERLFFTITPISSHVVSKEDRIRGLIPAYAQHLWLWPEKGRCVKKSLFDGKMHDMAEELEYEFLQFPLCEHDDLLDVQTFLDRMPLVKQKESVKTVEDRSGMTFGEYIKIKENRIAKLREGSWEKLISYSRR